MLQECSTEQLKMHITYCIGKGGGGGLGCLEFFQIGKKYIYNFVIMDLFHK